MKTLQELQPMILNWAKEKDLLKSENAPKQRLKLLEEVGETAAAMGRAGRTGWAIGAHQRLCDSDRQ